MKGDLQEWRDQQVEAGRVLYPLSALNTFKDLGGIDGPPGRTKRGQFRSASQHRGRSTASWSEPSTTDQRLTRTQDLISRLTRFAWQSHELCRVASGRERTPRSGKRDSANGRDHEDPLVGFYQLSLSLPRSRPGEHLGLPRG